MKKIISLAIFALMTLSPIATQAQQLKVLESSAKKTPSWLGASGADYLTANAQGPTLDEAKTAAFDNIKRQIIEAVALNIKASNSQTISQTSGQGGEIMAFDQKFADAFITQAAKLPFIQGISPTKASDFYWEKLQDKQSKALSYAYNIQYPFTRGELHKLTTEFNKIDGEMVAQLVAIEALPDTFTTTEQLDQALVTLQTLANYFFDDLRIDRTKAAQNLIQSQYSNLTPTLASTGQGEAISILSLGSRTISTNAKPAIKSNCASAINYVVDGFQTIITYDDQGCIADDENYLEISYRLGGKTIKSKIFYDINSGKLKATPEGTATIYISRGADSTETMEVSFTLNSNGVEAILESATITSPLSSAPLLFENQAIEVANQGPRIIRLHKEIGSNQLNVEPAGALKFIRGTLFFRITVSGQLIGVPINMKYSMR